MTFFVVLVDHAHRKKKDRAKSFLKIVLGWDLFEIASYLSHSCHRTPQWAPFLSLHYAWDSLVGANELMGDVWKLATAESDPSVGWNRNCQSTTKPQKSKPDQATCMYLCCFVVSQVHQLVRCCHVNSTGLHELLLYWTRGRLTGSEYTTRGSYSGHGSMVAQLHHQFKSPV